MTRRDTTSGQAYRVIVLLGLPVVLCLFVVIPALFVYAADPCHVFHKPFKGLLDHGFTPETRCQNAGLINSWLSDPAEGFDSVLIGASTSENFLPEYIAEKMHRQRTLKLTMVNMFPVEHYIVANRVIATGKVRQILWEVLPMLHHAPVSYTLRSISETDFFPAYLYSSSRLDDYRYIFNSATVSGSLDVLFREPYFESSIDRIRYWPNRCKTDNICNQFFSKEEIEKIQAEYQPVHHTPLNPHDIKQIEYHEFDQFMYPVLAKHCNTDLQFDLFFPPFSLLWFANLSEKDFYFEIYLLRHAVESTKQCRNIRVHAFYNDIEITADLSNYKDPKHFYGDIHNRMIDAIASGSHRVTADMLTHYEETLIGNVNAYRPYGSNLQPH